MRLLVYLPLLLSALAAVAARPLAARMEPRQATWLLTAATVVLAGCSMVALALLAASAAARIPLLATIGHYSQPVVRRSDPTPIVAGAAAAILLTVAGLAVTITVRRRARALAESYRRAARMQDDGTIVVVPGPSIEAYALPGWPGRIVVSGRLLSELDDGGRAALLAHEEAHLACRHHLFTSIAHLAAAANPLLLPLVHAVDYTVERWADEHAASATGNRRLVATTIAQVALLATPRRRQEATAALGIAGPGPRRISVAWAGPVPRRVAALLGPPPVPRTPLLAASAVLLTLAGASALQAARDLHSLLELARGIH
ncbi:MAG TPA: M48 family metalloprotease [Streptosporangiaceae bacterium]